MRLVHRVLYGPIEMRVREEESHKRFRAVVSELADVSVTIDDQRPTTPHHPGAPGQTRVDTRTATGLTGAEAWDFVEESIERMNEKYDDCSKGGANLQFRRRGRKGYIELDIGMESSTTYSFSYQVVITGVTEDHGVDQHIKE